MHKWPLPAGFVSKRPRPCDLASAARQFHVTPFKAAGEGKPASRDRPIRSRSATTSANVWDQVRNLPTQPASTPSVLGFDDAVRVTSARSLQNTLARGPPREVVRKIRPLFSATRQSPESSGRDQARIDLARFGRGSSSQVRRGGGQDRGSGRGGREGGGRGGRGRGRGGAGGPGLQRRSRGPRGSSAEDEVVGEEEQDEEEYTGYYQVLTGDEYIDNFVSLDEAQTYANVQEFVDEYEEAHDVLLAQKEELRAEPGWIPAQSRGIDQTLTRMDDDVKEALQAVVDADEKALPRHSPQEFSLDSQKGDLGGVPVGPSGMAHVVEDGLRYISDRLGSHWQDPKELARKLAAGDFVKFRNNPEKQEVLHLAESFESKTNTAAGRPHVGFEPPSPEAKEVLVKRLVEGRYKDPKDKTLRSDVLRNAARIAGGNATYPAGSKAMLLQTIDQLLPAERQAGPRGQARR